MSKTWYPVLNYEKCLECGTCFNKFPNRDRSCPGCCNGEEDSI